VIGRQSFVRAGLALIALPCMNAITPSHIHAQIASATLYKRSAHISALPRTCHTETKWFQGYHLDGTVDPTSKAYATATFCLGGTEAEQSVDAVAALRARRVLRLPSFLHVPGLATVKDYLGGSVPDNCALGQAADASGHATGGSSGYMHWEYVNPNDGQTIDYFYQALGGGGSGSWTAHFSGVPSNVSITNAKIYYTVQNAPWTITGGGCG